MAATTNLLISSVFCLASLAANAQPANDWENPGLVSQNALAPHAYFIPYQNEKQARAALASPLVQSLDGLWKFRLDNQPSARPLDFFKDGYDLHGWKDIKVPANWQVEGFDRFIFTDVEYPIPPNPPFVPADYNPVGSYKRNFRLSPDLKGKTVLIHLGAVNSFFYLWINGHYAGLSKDSKTPAEFDITRLLRPGTNSVSIQVFRFSDGTYLEGQDMWKLSGIERSIYLLARPPVHIRDFDSKALLDPSYRNGLFDLTVSLNRAFKSDSGHSLEVKLLDRNTTTPVFYEKKPLQDQDIFHFAKTIPKVRSWNAEHPELYTLIINQLDRSGQPVETITHELGFRTVEIRQGLLLLNGVAIKIKGVNRHEHDMYNGKVISLAGMENDIRLFKFYNINAMRCSHYPNREEWYQLCDRYGIYVIDEPNIECDGMDFHPLKTLSDKPAWKEAYLDRTRRMYERDKNFSCIITWSLGNESRWGENFIATHDYLKSRDSVRPVQYEEARDNPYTDIIAPMYKPLYIMQEYVKEWRDRPLIQVEYAHMMGNSGGNFKDDWEMIKKYPQLQGGFIWDFSDQTFKRKDENGRWIWAYGRDMGKVGATSDTSFCADGMLHADRSPHPQAYEVKKIYQNISFAAIPLEADKFTVTNHFDFTNLDAFDFIARIRADGKTLWEAPLETISLRPHQSISIHIPIPRLPIENATEYFLTIEARTKKPAELIPAKSIIAWEQFKLPWYSSRQNLSASESPALHLVEKENTVILSNEDYRISFSKTQGWLQSYQFKNSEFLYSPLLPDFWRAPTDNDIGNSLQIRCAVWKNPIKDARLDSFTVTPAEKGGFEIKTEYYLPAVDARYFARYHIKANGDLLINVMMKAGPRHFPELPRFGMQLFLQPPLDNVSWLGRGPFDNYCDRQSAAPIDLYSMKADSLFFPYARAQESGYRTDIRWMALQTNSGKGLVAIGDPDFSAGVLHFNPAKLEFNRDSSGNNHGGSMSNDPFICWNIDYRQMGVGGDNSWGSKTHSEYTLPYGDYEYHFMLRPVDTQRLTELVKIP